MPRQRFHARAPFTSCARTGRTFSNSRLPRNQSTARPVTSPSGRSPTQAQGPSIAASSSSSACSASERRRIPTSGETGGHARTSGTIALVADAIKDGTRKGDVVLDIFAGPGTTVMAAQRVGRKARALEVEPRLVDVAIRRWQAYTRRDAVHAESGLSFDETAARSDHAIAPNGNRGERK
jgi:DNA modification methylase